MQAQTDIRTEKIIQRGLELAATEGLAHAWVYLVAHDIHRHAVLRILSDATQRNGTDIFAEESMS